MLICDIAHECPHCGHGHYMVRIHRIKEMSRKFFAMIGALIAGGLSVAILGKHHKHTLVGISINQDSYQLFFRIDLVIAVFHLK